MSKYKNFQNQNKIFQNVSGRNIILTINQYDSQKMSVEFLIQETKKRNKLIKFYTLLFALISINIYSFYFEFIHSFYNYILSFIILILIFKIISTVTCEKLLVIKSLGVQVSVTYCTGIQSAMFIPWKSIKKVFINEVITMQKVIYFLTLMVQNEDGIITLLPLFQNVQPRLTCLNLIYSQIDEIIR